MSAILPPELIAKILSNLERRPDLLKCRLVSRSWKQESTHLIQKSNACIRLSDKTLGEYVNFLEKCKYQISALPVHLYVDHTSPPWAWFPPPDTRLDDLSAHVDKVTCSGFNPVVKNLTLRLSVRDSPQTKEKLAKVLSKISPELQFLNLILEFNGSNAENYTHQFSFCSEFPNLRHFRLENDLAGDDVGVDENRPHLFTLDPSKFPSLKILDFPSNWTFVGNDSPPMLFPSATNLSVQLHHRIFDINLPTEWIRSKIELNRIFGPLLTFFPNATTAVANLNVTIIASTPRLTNKLSPHVNTVTCCFSAANPSSNPSRTCTVETVEILDCKTGFIASLLEQLGQEEVRPKVVLSGQTQKSYPPRHKKLKNLMRLMSKYEAQRQLQLHKD